MRQFNQELGTLNPGDHNNPLTVHPFLGNRDLGTLNGDEQEVINFNHPTMPAHIQTANFTKGHSYKNSETDPISAQMNKIATLCQSSSNDTEYQPIRGEFKLISKFGTEGRFSSVGGAGTFANNSDKGVSPQILSGTRIVTTIHTRG